MFTLIKSLFIVTGYAVFLCVVFMGIAVYVALNPVLIP